LRKEHTVSAGNNLGTLLLGLGNEAGDLVERSLVTIERWKEDQGSAIARLEQGKGKRGRRAHMTGPRKFSKSSQAPSLMSATCFFISSPQAGHWDLGT
jgi:hypothetical protein